ncbi:acetyl-CoA carboxylase [Ceratobasidium sp. AG-Ba]|nr:acetyl-CoA carboxylase [Ceratobasidium sp. AG-Ba]
MAACKNGTHLLQETKAEYIKKRGKAQQQWKDRMKAGYEDYGRGMDKDAKIWKTYITNTDKADEELIDGWNKSLDVLLIFAALFSAISTAFVAISAQDLQQDSGDTSTETLLHISQTLTFMASGGVNSTLPSRAVSQSTVFAPSHTAIVVNILWFMSLSLSVATSLITMLVEEWCLAFMSGRSGETYERARLRQKRWNEIERLRMIDVLTLLPLLMHLALLLFAVGLCIYLWDISVPVAIPVVVITLIATLIYIVTIVHSLSTNYCPYTTASSKPTYNSG